MDKNLFQEYELDAFLGDHRGDFDVEAIVCEATYMDHKEGKRYWKDDIDLTETCRQHEKGGRQ